MTVGNEAGVKRKLLKIDASEGAMLMDLDSVRPLEQQSKRKGNKYESPLIRQSDQFLAEDQSGETWEH